MREAGSFLNAGMMKFTFGLTVLLFENTPMTGIAFKLSIFEKRPIASLADVRPQAVAPAPNFGGFRDRAPRR